MTTPTPGSDPYGAGSAPAAAPGGRSEPPAGDGTEPGTDPRYATSPDATAASGHATETAAAPAGMGFDPFRFGRPEPGSPAAAAFPDLFPPQSGGPTYPPSHGRYRLSTVRLHTRSSTARLPTGLPAARLSTVRLPTARWSQLPGARSRARLPAAQPGTGLGYPPPQQGNGFGYPPPHIGPGVGFPTGYGDAPGFGYPGSGGDGTRPGNGKAVAGLVLGIASVVLFFFTVFDIIPIALAYVFSIQGLQATKRGKGQRGLALAGIVLASVATVILIAVVAFLAVRINHCQQHHDQGTKAYNQCVIDF